MIRLRFCSFTVILLFFVINLSAVDIDNGDLRLRINDKSGSFSLFYLTDMVSGHYEPLFYSREPQSSYLSVNVDDRIYQLGSSKDFSAGISTNNGNTTVTYQSPFITVTEVFTPVRTFSFASTNGVKIDITLQNTGTQSVSAGLRMLIDTSLGEGRRNIPPLVTNNHAVTGELVIEDKSGELYWISRGQNLSLMGIIVNPFSTNTINPDYVHIANWKRLNSAPWKLEYKEGRSFNYRPYSVDDSAVCYYYEPKMLEAGDSITFTVFLTTEDITWYNLGQSFDFASYQQTTFTNDNDIDQDYQLLLRMQDTLNKILADEIPVSEQVLDDIERNIERLKEKFNY